MGCSELNPAKFTMSYSEQLEKASSVMEHLVGPPPSLPWQVHESFRYSCVRRLRIRLFFRSDADRRFRSASALDIVRIIEAEPQKARDLKAEVQTWIRDYEAFYDDFGGRNAFFIFILKRSMVYRDNDAVTRAKQSIIDWYESNRSLRLIGIQGVLGGAAISPEWLLPFLTFVAKAALARGVIALGRAGLEKIRDSAKQKLLGVIEDGKSSQGASFVPDSYLSLFKLSVNETETLVEHWARSFEAFCEEMTLAEREVIDELIAAKPFIIDGESVKRVSSLVAKDFVKFIENQPGSTRAVFMPPRFEMVAKSD